MLFGKLSDTDKHLIQSWITDYAHDDVNSSDGQAPLSYLLRYWDNNKVNLYHMFGDNFILSKQIMFEKDASDMEREVSDSLYFDTEKSMRPFYLAVDHFLRDHYEEFGSSVRWNIMDLFEAQTLAKNEYTGFTFMVPVPDGKKPIQVQSGCKPVKILGKIAQAWNIEGFEEFRLEHSRILNQKMLRGELCISIHPMDYMTMSDNDCDWDSCMSWRNDGCYRRGTVEMMNSDCVVVAYLRAKGDMRFYNKYWNNKKWRQLFVVQQDYIVGVKGYPYQHNALADAVIDWLAELAQEHNHWEYKPTCYDMEHEHWFKVDGENWKLSFFTDTMYNDFGTCTHRVRVGMDPTQKYEHYYQLNYSGPAVCMYCGETDKGYDNEGALSCNECAEVYYCACCEDGHSRDDMYEVDGSYYCEYCYNEHIVRCPITDYEHFDSDMFCLWVVPEGQTVVDRYAHRSILIDIDAVNEMSDKDYKEFFKKDDRKFKSCAARWDTCWFVTTDELTEEGLALFDIDNAEELAAYLELKSEV